MKKKIVALLLTLVMLVGIIPAAVYAAEADTKVTLEVVADKETAMPGDEITYTVTMKTEYALTAMGFITSFPEGLTYVDGSGAVNPDAKATLGCDDYEWVEWTRRTSMGAQEGENKLQGIASSPNKVSEIVLCTFKAKVDEDAELKDGYEVALIELVEFMDADWEQMAEEEIEVIVSAINVVDHVCVDNLTAVEAKDPTCTEDGNTAYYECSECGVKYLDADATELAGDVIVPATGHDNGEWVEVTAATCTEAGLKERRCTVCGTVLETEEPEALGHDKGEWVVVKEANCTEAGLNELRCTVCATVLDTEEPEALGHTEGEVKYENVSDATCTEGGSGDAVIYCTVCGEELSRETTEVPALGHTDGEWVTVTEATCTEAGLKELHCAVCDVVIDEEEIAALGHTEAEAVEENRVEADCVNEGSYDMVVYCEVCGEELSKESFTIEALGHTEAEAVEENRVPATCTEEGSYEMVVYCSVCDAELSREKTTIPALGHTEAEAVEENRVPATCTEDGSYEMVVYCSVCDAELSREKSVIAAPGHDYVAAVTAPTCTEEGFTTYTCSVCGDNYVADKVAATGHSIPDKSEWVESETEKGKFFGYCENGCGYSESEIRKVPATAIELDQTSVKTKYIRKAPAFTLTETVLPEDQLKLDYEVIWSSSNEKVATVDEDGNVTTHHFGDAVITATLVDADGNVIDTATCEVNVYYTFCQWLIWFFLLGCAWYFV